MNWHGGIILLDGFRFSQPALRRCFGSMLCGVLFLSQVINVEAKTSMTLITHHNASFIVILLLSEIV
jgi:hypothetical protein